MLHKNNYCVYKHTSPSGKSYIGITGRNPSERWGANGNGYKGQPKFYNAILKYGWDNITHEILFTGLTLKEALSLEIASIEQYDTYIAGYNSTRGGEGTSGVNNQAVYCEETDTIYFDGHEAAKILRLSHKSISQCCNERIKSTHGLHFSFVDTNRAKQNKELRESNKYASTNGNPVPISMYDLDGVHIRDFDSIKEAAQFMGYPAYLISKNCRGLNNNCRNHIFAYRGSKPNSLEDLDVSYVNGEPVYKQSKSFRPVLQFDRDGNFLARYGSVIKASKCTQIKSSIIKEACNKRNRLGNGFYWMYEDAQYELKPHKDYGPKKVYCYETGETFNTAREASEITGVHWKNISRNCTGERKSAGGLHFSFADSLEETYEHENI